MRIIIIIIIITILLPSLFHSTHHGSSHAIVERAFGGDISRAVSSYHSGESTSLRQAAVAFKVPYATLQRRVSGGLSRSHAHESQQILSTPEEKTLVRWLTHLTATGSPATPALVVEMALEIRNGRLQLEKSEPVNLQTIRQHWVDRSEPVILRFRAYGRSR